MLELVRISELRWIVAHFYGTQMNINLWSGQKKKNQWCTFLKFALIFSVLFSTFTVHDILNPTLYAYFDEFLQWFLSATQKNGIRKKMTQVGKKVRCRLWKVDLYVNKFEYNLFGLNREAANIVTGHTAESSNRAWWFNI